MANVIGSDDLGTDQTSQVNQSQIGQGNNNVNQAGQAPIQNTSQGGSTSGQSASSGGTNGAPTVTGSQVNNPNQQKGSGYTNIQKVIGANQGNQLGSAVGNNIQQTATSAQKNLQDAQGQFSDQTNLNQANTEKNQQLAQNVLNDPTQYVGTGQNAQQGQQFQNLISGQYQGPTALGNASQLQNQASNVAQQGQALGTAGGRIGLLQQLVGNPQYTSGQANLDSLLLGQSNDPSLQAAKRQALTLQGQVGSAVQGAAAQGQQETNQAQQFGTALQGQLNNNITGQNQKLQQTATDAQQTNNKSYTDALAALQSGSITQQEADLLGLTQGENVYNVLNGAGSTGNSANNAAQFLQQNPNQANVGNTATAQQYAQMQALQKLGGQYLNQNAQSAEQNFQNPSQAGTYAQQQNLIGNKDSFQNALNATQSNYQSILQPAQQAQQQMQQVQDIWNRTNLPGNDPNSLSMNAANDLVGKLTQGGATQGQNVQQDKDWAATQYAKENAALAAAQQQLLQQYGSPETINIASAPNTPDTTSSPVSIGPSSYPAISLASGPNSNPTGTIGSGGLEKFPTVS